MEMRWVVKCSTTTLLLVGGDVLDCEFVNYDAAFCGWKILGLWDLTNTLLLGGWKCIRL